MSDDIIVRINGDSNDIFNFTQRAETAANNAEQSEKDVETLKAESVAAKEQAEKYSQNASASANSASNSNTLAQSAANRAEEAANRASAYDPNLKTSLNGSILSDSTGHYNFQGPLTAVVTAPGEFNIGFDDSGLMKDSVYDPNGIASDVYDRNNHTGQQAIATISGLQAVLDSKADSATGPGGANPLLMTKAVYDPQNINGDAFDRTKHTGIQPISTVDGLQTALDGKVDDSEITGSNIASLYEALPDRNQFSNTLLSKLNSITTGANMLKSVYDPSNVGANAFNPANHNYENWPENAVVTVVNGKPTYAKIKAIDGKIIVSSNSIEMGPHLMSSAGENIMWRNLHTGKIYSPPWQEVNRANSKLPTYRIYTDNNMSSSTVPSVGNDEITNPIWKITSRESRRIFAASFKSARDTKEAIVTVKAGNDVIWEGVIGDLKLNKTTLFNLDSDSVPFDYYKNEEVTFSMSSEYGDVVLFGDSSLSMPKVTYFYRVFDEIPIPDMDSSIYDKNNDGIVDEADAAQKIVGIDSAANNQYYGKNALGSVGFFDLPDSGGSGSGSGNGDMLKSVYDTDDDGKVNLAVAADRAAMITGVNGVGPLHYYGKDADGNVGFHLMPAIAGGKNHLFDDLSEGEIPSWDATDNKMNPSGIRKIAGQIIAEPSGLYMGDVGLSTDGNGLTINPLGDPKTYKVLTQAIEARSDVAYIRSYGNPQEKVIHSGYTDQIKNPVISFSADKDSTLVSLIVKSSEAIKDLLISFRNSNGENIWSESFFNLDAGKNTLSLSTPPDVNSGETINLVFTGKSYTADYVRMDGTGTTPFLTINLIDWVDNKIATEQYVTSGVSGLEDKIDDSEINIDKLVNELSLLSNKLGDIHNYFVYRGKTPPKFPIGVYSGYFGSMYALSKRETIVLPNPDGIRDGTHFFIKNEDKNNSIRLEVSQGVTIKGGTALNIPPQNTVWLVRSGIDWLELMSGYLPTSYSAFLSDIKIALSKDTTFLKSLSVQGDDPNAAPLDVSKISFTGCDVEHDSTDSKLAHIQPRLGVDFINPNGSRVNKVTEVKLIGMEIKDPGDGTPPKLIILDHQNVPQPVDTSAYAFFDASATAPETIKFQSLPVFRGGRVTVHKDNTNSEYAYVILPPGEGTETERIGELGGLPSYWSKQSKDYNIGGTLRTYTVFRSPYPFHETDLNLVLYP